MARNIDPADQLESLCYDLNELVFEVREQRHVADVERNEEEARRIASAIIGVFRG